MRLIVVLSLLLVGKIGALSTEDFYDFGSFYGDRQLSAEDDVSTQEVVLTTPIAFFDKIYFSIFINSNGLLSFLTEIPYFYNAQFPLDYPAIAPFYSDVDLTAGGNVWYRESNDPGTLNRAREELGPHFTGADVFEPASVFIVTWEEVGYYNAKNDKQNTYQVVIVTNGRESFVILNYPKGGLQWLVGEGKTSGLKDANAQAGFISEDRRLYTLRGSGTDQIRNLDKWSNVDITGKYIFKVGKMAPNRLIQPPDLVDGIKVTGLPESVESTVGSCATGGSICHSLAQCVDYESGFCCQCGSNFYGNGINCLEKSHPIRVTGKMNGMINGMNISEADLHSYVLPNEGRTYTAISRISKDVGYDLQSLTSIGEGIAWLFATPTDGVKNGFIQTGGVFNRTVEVNFPQTGHKATIRQEFNGLDVFNNVAVSINVSGSIPTVPYRSEVVVDAFNEEFTRVERGKLRSRSHRSFKLKDQSLSTPFNVETFVEFWECEFDQIPPEHQTLRLKIAENIFIRYDEAESIVRYSFNSKIGTLEEEDPCLEGKHTCDVNSQCIVDGDTFRCVCKQGYDYVFDSLTNLAICLDMNECDLGRDQCDVNAICLNSPGSYSCHCKPGFIGSGFHCESEFTCANAGCDPNALCEMLGGQPTCHCSPGYKGDGFFCAPDFGHESCHITQNCSPYAVCAPDDAGGFSCKCLEGYTGDGRFCNSIIEETIFTPYIPEPQVNIHQPGENQVNTDCSAGVCWCPHGYVFNEQLHICDLDSNVQFEFEVNRPEPYCNEDGICSCPQGFVFNHLFEECDLEDLTETPQPICYDGHCLCPSGYEFVRENLSCILFKLPDSITGVETTDDLQAQGNASCDVYNNCHPNALCIYSIETGSSKCSCNVGFTGDGFSCTPEQITCDQVPDICHENAECVYDDRRLASVCVCKVGFIGDGTICTPEDECNSYQDCDPNAQCTYDTTSSRYICSCNKGYNGDGLTCTPTGGTGCDVLNNCAPTAECVYDDRSFQYRCQCRGGYQGDGYYCQKVEVGCNIINNCGLNAECIYLYEASGYKCRCKDGFEGDGFDCLAIESCLTDASICHGQATCQQNGDEYGCVCNPGFVGDGVTCEEAPDHEKNLLLINQGLSVLRMPLDSGKGMGSPIVVDAFMTAVGADVDCLEGRYYWTDVGSKSIRSCNYDGSQKRPVIKGGGVGAPEDVAVDWVARNLYWTDSANDVIGVANYEGDKMKTIVEGGLHNPRGIAVHPGLGLVFWCDWNRSDPKIEAVAMDGSERRKLVSGEGISLPNSLVVDYETGMVCWADAGTNRIECVGITGYSRRVIKEGAIYPYGLAIHYRSFYYSDWDDSLIHEVNKYTGEEVSTRAPPLGGYGKLYDIAAVPDGCRPVRNVCQSSGRRCPSTHLCLPNGKGGKTCACPSNSPTAANCTDIFDA